jgi:dihydrofolate synthase/folylpolyglutamate synthase
MNYFETLDWLFGLEHMGVKLGLDNVKELLQRLGDPQDEFRTVNVAGTNGKGSVSAMLASILCEQGYRTGLYTSPHMVEFRERIQCGKELISEVDLAKLAMEVRGQWEEMERATGQIPTFFEVTTAMAFLHFADKGIEEAVIEVGMGGRLDATNVINPDCSIITNISMEHTQYLGNTLSSGPARSLGCDQVHRTCQRSTGPNSGKGHRLSPHFSHSGGDRGRARRPFQSSEVAFAGRLSGRECGDGLCGGART